MSGPPDGREAAGLKDGAPAEYYGVGGGESRV